MKIEKLQDGWLFQRHSKQALSEWVTQLRYFYFVRAWGGHANDGDSFKAAFNYEGRQDLIAKLDQLGATLDIIPDNFPRPVIGQPYPYEEFQKFKSEIRGNEDLEQPGHKAIFGYMVFIWVGENVIEISVSGTKDGNRYEVSSADFDACLNLEEHFDSLGWIRFLDKTMEQHVCCVSASKYPELFA